LALSFIPGYIIGMFVDKVSKIINPSKDEDLYFDDNVELDLPVEE